MSRAAEILNSPFTRIRQALDRREVSSRELTAESLRRAQSSNATLNAFITLNQDAALKEADLADHRIKSGEKGPLLGVPVAVKDLILTRELKTTAASKMLENFVPPYDATVVARLRASGAPVIGKANLDEFAMGSSNETSHFGPCRNPWDTTRVPGGSSGGSAAAVAARIAPIALGTDTGGSIRQPSSLCGITGLKPTYGRVSRYGVVAFASSLDQVGPMAVDAPACAALLEAISGHDIHDATSAKQDFVSFYEESNAVAARASLDGLVVGVPSAFLNAEGLEPDVKTKIEEAIEFLKSSGAKVVEVELPHSGYALPTYYLICTSEASSNLARYDGIHYGHRSASAAAGNLEQLYSKSRREGFGEEVRLRVLLGTYALSSGFYDAFYKKAAQVRALIRKDFEEAFKKCDVIVGPTSPTTAFRLNEKTMDPLAMYLSDIFTLSANLAGLPGLSFNVGYDSKNLPIGLQLLGPWWEDSLLMGIAAFYQARKPESVGLSPVAREFASEAGA